MYIITTLDKDLYTQAQVFGKIASILVIAKICTPEIAEKVRRNIPEIEHIQSKFNLLEDHSKNTREMQNCLQTLNNLSSWLLHQIHNCPQASFLQEELSTLISLAEQRMILLREK